ncbi:Cys-tRNA(Pro) deacylase [Oscillatoria sp. CS-180]|uniref:Cys-tRNA(Pro) deacylase n=1 Tax=Oscillatoria sp. CS-180 TaxID=3021720 RepID=UPI00232DE326|nr:Cys-tRNA(Pro) deacylase [Oscillatoria sp. CS-180]MDB9526725.1 Cys-tRNA(Pro) deacylase [Oscillatoria sp. CS-180]
MKTNAARILEQQSIPYELLFYEVDPNDLAAERAADKLGLPHEQVFKTLVARGDRSGVCLAVIPANAKLNLKALAKMSDNKKVETVPLKEVQGLTGYIRGGVTALGCKKSYPVFLDISATQFDKIAVSAGKRGQMLLVSPTTYQIAVQGTIGAIAN